MLDRSSLAALDYALLHRPAAVAGLVVSFRDGVHACEARRHPYGFVVVSLGSLDHAGGRLAYRLHLWPEGFRLPGSADLMVHDHVYDIVSHVLAGALVQHEYVEDEHGAPFASYRGLYDGPHSVLERLPGVVRVRESAVERIEAGRTYVLPAGALHMVMVDSAIFTATVLRTRYDKGRTDPLILAPLNAPASYRFDRDLIPDAVSATAVEELFRRLRWKETAFDGSVD